MKSLLYYCYLFIEARQNNIFCHTVFLIFISMKNINIEDILKESGLDAFVLCYRHDDRCNCHESYKEAA